MPNSSARVAAPPAADRPWIGKSRSADRHTEAAQAAHHSGSRQAMMPMNRPPASSPPHRPA
eukprot:9406051-Pyramimonas_sp.AAC.1